MLAVTVVLPIPVGCHDPDNDGFWGVQLTVHRSTQAEGVHKGLIKQFRWRKVVVRVLKERHLDGCVGLHTAFDAEFAPTEEFG